MKKIKNTSKSPKLDWLFGGNPNAILNQEKEGQNQLVESSYNENIQQLPVKGENGLYEKLGIKIIGKSKNDDIFYDVNLPKGWKIKPTDHKFENRVISVLPPPIST